MIDYPIHGSQWFDVREWVDERTWGILGPKSAWQIDTRIVRIADLVRELSGAGVMVNNWHYWKSGSKYRSSGLRAKWDSTGGQLSQHRRGCAADLKVTGMSPEQVFSLIQNNKPAFLAAGLTTLESLKFTPTWIHVDCRPWLEGQPEGEFLIVEP